jgi:hypothetical protein
MSANLPTSWKENNFESWFRKNPQLPDGEHLLIVGIHQPIRRMVDLIALDKNGGLVILEVKNESSNRKAIGQALEYLSIYDDLSLEELADDFEEFTGSSLEKAFLDAFDHHITQLTKHRRVFLVAPRHDSYSAVCASYLGKLLAERQIEIGLLEATEEGNGFRIVKVQPKPFLRLGALPRGFAINPRGTRLFYVIQPGSEPIVWNVGRWSERDRGVTVRVQPSPKLLRRYRSHLLPLELPPHGIDFSASGSVWIPKRKHERKAIVIGQITTQEAGQPKSYIAFAQFQNGQFQTFRRRPADTFHSNWDRVDDKAISWSEIVDQAKAMLDRKLKNGTDENTA